MGVLFHEELMCPQAYQDAKPSALGSLHQRMKAVMKRAQEIGLSRIDNTLWQALFDLQTEVAHHKPAKPPYGHRPVRRSTK